jgi:hypothetical protein
MNDSVDITQFVERIKRERSAAGLPPTITDAGTLHIIASIVSAPRNITSIVSAPRNIEQAAA